MFAVNYVQLSILLLVQELASQLTYPCIYKNIKTISRQRMIVILQCQSKIIFVYRVVCVYRTKMQTEIDRDDRFMQISDMCCARAIYDVTYLYILQSAFELQLQPICGELQSRRLHETFFLINIIMLRKMQLIEQQVILAL